MPWCFSPTRPTSSTSHAQEIAELPLPAVKARISSACVPVSRRGIIANPEAIRKPASDARDHAVHERRLLPATNELDGTPFLIRGCPQRSYVPPPEAFRPSM